MTEHAPQPTSVLLNASGLRKRYTVGRKLIDVLKGVDLEVLTGEFLSIVGASGSGKAHSCTFSVGWISPTEETCRFRGRILQRWRVWLFHVSGTSRLVLSFKPIICFRSSVP